MSLLIICSMQYLESDSSIVSVNIDKFSIIIPLVISIDNLAELNADFEKRYSIYLC